MTYKIKRKVIEGYIPLADSIEKELDKEPTDIKENLDEELNNFLSGLFRKYNIEIDESLQYDFPLENDFAILLNSLDDYISSVLKANNDIKKRLVIEGVS